MLAIILLIFLYNVSFHLLIFGIIILLPFWIAYSVGMTDYAIKNNVGTREIETERIWESLMDEWYELIDEMRERNIIGIFMEFHDVVHSLCKYLVIKYLSLKLVMRRYFWFLIFLFVVPASLKHGYRFLISGCIRNHHNKHNLDHKCCHGKFFGIL